MTDDHNGSGKPGDFRIEEVERIVGQIGRSLQDGPGKIPWMLLGIVLLILVILGLSGTFYAVDVQESAVVLRFGKHLESAGTIGPGLHAKIPFGVDKVYKEKVKEVKKEEFGYKTLKAGIETQYEVMSSLMLTGDLNVANVQSVVRYQIVNLPNYLFSLRDVQAAVRDISEAVMRRVVGDYSVDEVLTIGRQEIQTTAQEQIQELLQQYGAGIKVVAVRLQESTPPEEVRDAFNEVNRALQEKQQVMQEAEGERNRQIPAARGDKERMILEAEGYKIQKVNRAAGDVAEFEAVLDKYKVAKEITRQRLYLETMAKVLSKAGRKYIIEGEEGVLKLLPLEQIPVRKGGE